MSENNNNNNYSFQYEEMHQQAKLNITTTTTIGGSGAPLSSYSIAGGAGVPSITESAMISNICEKCKEHVYPLEGLVPIMNVRYHKKCFKCAICQTHLDLKTYHTNLVDLNDRHIYCIAHKPKDSKPLSMGLYAISNSNNNQRSKSPSLIIGSSNATISPNSEVLPVYYEDDEKSNNNNNNNFMVVTTSRPPNKLNDSSSTSSSSGELNQQIGWKDQQNQPNQNKEQKQKIVTQTFGEGSYGRKEEENAYKYESSASHVKEENSKSLTNQTISQTIIDPTNHSNTNNNSTKFELNNNNNNNSSSSNLAANKDNNNNNNNNKVVQALTSGLIHKDDSNSNNNQLVAACLNNPNEMIAAAYSKIPNRSAINLDPSTASFSSLVIQEKSESSFQQIQQTVVDAAGKTTNVTKTDQSASEHHEMKMVGGADQQQLSDNRKNNKSESSLTFQNVDPNRPAIKPRENNSSSEELILGEDKGFGKIKLTVFYSELQSRLSITVHEARNLVRLDKKGTSDPFARVYLLPDSKNKKSKRKSKVIKDNTNPVWDETFDYQVTFAEANSKDLLVNLKDEKGIFEKNDTFMGEVLIDMRKIDMRKQPFTRWYYLQPKSRSTDILLNADSVML